MNATDVNASGKLIFHHCPNTRSSIALTLLEELAIPYKLHVLNRHADELKQPEYLAINPMGKVPALSHGGAVITEQAAIFIYLGDLAPEAGLAPAIGDPLRGPYLRWLAFYAASFEPALIDRALKRDPGPYGMMPYGDYETTISVVRAQLAKGPYLFGDRFTAADILWGAALNWTASFGLIEKTPEIDAYIARVVNRPAAVRVRARDAELEAAQKA
jgi:glutathione S-transferase